LFEITMNAPKMRRMAVSALTGAVLVLAGCVTQPMLLQSNERVEVSELALLVADVFDMYKQHPTNLKADSILGKGWEIDGYVVGDAKAAVTYNGAEVFSVGGGTVMYGVLAHKKGENPAQSYVLAIRGTADANEWKVNAFSMDRLALTAEQGKGTVAKGFYSIYQTLRYIPNTAEATAAASSAQQAWQSIKGVVGAAPVTVVGHSLGSAMSTYMMTDLAGRGGLGAQVHGRLLASPRPGDEAYANFVTSTVPDYVVYNNVSDLVPQMPSGSFATLKNEKVLMPDNFLVKVSYSPVCSHQLVSYAAGLGGIQPNRSLDFWKKRMKDSGNSPTCIESK
jgi:hypothetical protein